MDLLEVLKYLFFSRTRDELLLIIFFRRRLSIVQCLFLDSLRRIVKELLLIFKERLLARLLIFKYRLLAWLLIFKEWLLTRLRLVFKERLLTWLLIVEKLLLR